jgi:hypothetical protein
MKLIDHQEFEKLANYKNDVCVSLFIPTNRRGKEVIEEKDRSLLKSRWDECRRELEKKGVASEKIKKLSRASNRIL